MRNIFAVLILLAMHVGGSAQENVPIETVESIQHGVVPIACLRFNTKNEIESKKVFGTGFFINRQGYFLTAGHVIVELKSFSEKNQCLWAVFVPTTTWKDRSSIFNFRWFVFTECRYRSEDDVAVCKPKDNPFLDDLVNKYIRPLSFRSFNEFGDGSPVAFTGFPFELLSPVTSKGFIASYLPVDRELLIDKSAWPGASGSPVYDPRGNVIGILIKRGYDTAAGLAFARPSDFILDFLRAENILAEQQKDNRQQKPSRKKRRT